jgi:hypothetical protein
VWQRVTVEPSMDRGLSGRGGPDLAARAIRAIEPELEGRSLAVERRALVQFRAEGLGFTGSWPQRAPGPETCAPNRGRICLTLITSSVAVHAPPDQSYGLRVRVYGAGTLGLRVWDVLLDRAFEVEEVRMLLSVPGGAPS